MTSLLFYDIIKEKRSLLWEIEIMEIVIIVEGAEFKKEKKVYHKADRDDEDWL